VFRLTSIVLLLLSLVLLATACDGDSSPKPSAELLAARQGIPQYELSEPRGEGSMPPGFYDTDDQGAYAADATYFVGIPDAREDIARFYEEQMPKLGWTWEDPPVPSRYEQLASYCATPGWVTCVSFSNETVRGIIVMPLTFSFSGGVGREGSAYHIHVEEK
jgi:hypothetical protein